MLYYSRHKPWRNFCCDVRGVKLCHSDLVKALGEHLAQSPWFKRRVRRRVIIMYIAESYHVVRYSQCRSLHPPQHSNHCVMPAGTRRETVTFVHPSGMWSAGRFRPLVGGVALVPQSLREIIQQAKESRRTRHTHSPGCR